MAGALQALIEEGEDEGEWAAELLGGGRITVVEVKGCGHLWVHLASPRLSPVFHLSFCC